MQEQTPTSRVVNADEIRPIHKWERLYPDLWMLIEVTREDQWEGYEGKLVATAVDPMELVNIGRSYDERGIVTLETRGDYGEPQPSIRRLMSRTWLQFSTKRAPVVSVRLGNGVFRALVDTGAEVNRIAPNASLRLGLKKLGNREILVLGGGLLSCRTTNHRLRKCPTSALSRGCP
jgi:hypothetical protein